MSKPNLNLGDLVNHTRGLMGKVCSVRQELGLKPIADTLPMLVRVYDSDSLAYARHVPDMGSFIAVNVLPVVQRKNSKPEHAALRRYFNAFREVIFDLEEEEILSFIYQEKPDIASFLKEKLSEDDMIQKWDWFNERGTSLAEYCDFLQRNAAIIRDVWESVSKDIVDAYKESEEDVLCYLLHEVDHTDIYDTKMFQDTQKLQYKLIELEEDLEKNSKEYAKLKMEHLRKRSEVCALLESRAILLSFVGDDITKIKTEKEKITKQAILSYLDNKVNCEYMEEIAIALLAKEWSKGTMNRTTSNYILKTVNDYMRSEGSSRYRVDSEDVNLKVANRILYRELPKWQNRFAENVMKVTPVLADALADHPERFEKAREAETLDEYVKILQEESKNADL